MTAALIDEVTHRERDGKSGRAKLVLGGCIVGAFVLAGIFASLIAPADPLEHGCVDGGAPADHRAGVLALGLRPLQAGGHVQERALPGPRRAHHGGEGTGGELHGDPIERDDRAVAGAVDLADVVERHGRERGRLSCGGRWVQC